MEYILTWSNGIGRVSAGDFLYDITEKPNVGFAFDNLYFETPTSMHMKVLQDTQLALTEQEQKLCKQYCENYYNSDEFKVFALDPDLKILKGFMTRGECKANGYEEVIDTVFPEYPLVKRVNDKWERVVAVISQNGKLVLLPEGDHPAFNFFFTQEEWDKFQKPTYIDEVFDFKEEKWVDDRKLDETKETAKLWIKNIFHRQYDKYKLETAYMDLILYLIQSRELSTYENDKTASTPFVDSAVLQMKNETKDGFMERIYKHYEEDYLVELGEIHGKMMQKLDEINMCTTVAEVDNLMRQYNDEATNTIWRRPVNVDPYASIR